MANFSETVANPGTGGAKVASDTFTQGADQVTIFYSGLAFGTLAGGSYQAVDLTHGLPVDLVAGSVVIGAGSAIIGQVELTDGTNILGTTSHPVRTDPTGTTAQPISAAQGTLTDRSGTITAGGTAQQLAAVNSSRKFLFIQNLDASNDLWINFTTAAVQSQPSLKLSAGASFTFEGNYVSTELISVIGSTTGQAFAAKEG